MYLFVQFLLNYFEILQGSVGILTSRYVFGLIVHLYDASKFLNDGMIYKNNLKCISSYTFYSIVRNRI